MRFFRRMQMKKTQSLLIVILVAVGLTFLGCSTAYKAQPLPFKAPSAYPNSVQIEALTVGGQAFADAELAQKAFGFDVRGANMLPVQLVFDNQGAESMEIVADQTFLEDRDGNLWPILSSTLAYERATKFARTTDVAKQGAYKGFLGAAAGSIIGAAIGIVTGEDVASTIGKGAAVGAAAGSTIGGAAAYDSDDARRAILQDFREKSLQNKEIAPQNLAHGILFFPGEAPSAEKLRLQIWEKHTGKNHLVMLDFGATQ